LQNNNPQEKNPRPTDNKSSDNGAPIVPLEESIKQNKLKILKNANTQNAIVEDFNNTPTQDTDMPDPTSDNDDRPIRLNRNKKKRKLVNQYALLSDDDDDDEDDNATSIITADPTSRNTNTSPPKHGILNIVSPKGKGNRNVNFATTCDQEQSAWRTLKQDPNYSPQFLHNPATLRQNKHQRKMEIQLTSLERDTGIDNIVYGASLTRADKHKTRITPPKQSRTSKPKMQSSLFTFVKKTKPKTHPHRKLFLTGDDTDITPGQCLNDTTSDTTSVNTPTKTPPYPPNRNLPLDETQVPPTTDNDTHHEQGNTPTNGPNGNDTPISPKHHAHSPNTSPTTNRPSNDRETSGNSTRNTRNRPSGATITTPDTAQH
jgi:hypothetical protein